MLLRLSGLDHMSLKNAVAPPTLPAIHVILDPYQGVSFRKSGHSPGSASAPHPNARYPTSYAVL